MTEWAADVQAMSREQARDAAAAAEQQREALEQRLDTMAAYVDAARAAAIAAGGAEGVQASAHSRDQQMRGNSGQMAANGALPARPAARALAQQFAEVAREVDSQVLLPPRPPLSSPGLLGALSEAAARVMGGPTIQSPASGTGVVACPPASPQRSVLVLGGFGNRASRITTYALRQPV